MQGNAILSQSCAKPDMQKCEPPRHKHLDFCYMHLHKGIILSTFINLPEGILVGLVTAIVTFGGTKEKRLQNINCCQKLYKR